MKALFADAFYYVALLNRADQHHEKALAFASGEPFRMFTTAWVLTEVADALAASSSRSKLAGFLRALGSESDTLIVAFSDALYARGIELYDSRRDKHWTLTDCISFVVMKDERLSEALTGDHHFEQAGFKALLK